MSGQCWLLNIIQENTMTRLKRDKMIRELNHSGYSFQQIVDFMNLQPLSLRTIQSINKKQW